MCVGTSTLSVATNPTALIEIIPPWAQYHRLVPSRYPPVNIFENLVDPAELDAVFAVESLTNDRLRNEVGDIALIDPDDRVVGPGATVVMAPFTHTGNSTRFSNGTYGVFYATSSIEGAIAETKFHRTRFLQATSTPPLEITMREYVGATEKPLVDIREAAFEHLYDPDPAKYSQSQAFGAECRDEGCWGLLFRGVRLQGSECLAAFKPAAVALPVQARHFRYLWDGAEIVHVLQVSAVGVS